MAYIKPIETRYKNYRFRSRLEARWAVSFDYIDLDWIYEPEGYDLGECGWYLPDFYLHQVNMFVEVKPDGGFTKDALNKCRALVLGLKCGMLLAEGLPASKPAINGYVFNNEVNDVIEAQFEIYNSRWYHLTEHRFFSNPGWYPECDYGYCMDDLIHVEKIVKAARFEHGEHGA